MLKRAKKLIFKYRVYILGIFILGIILDIFLNPRISDFAVLILGLLWILTISNFKFEPQKSFAFASASYGISFIFQFFKQEMIMEKGASWFFVFLLIGLVQFLIKNFGEDEKKN